MRFDDDDDEEGFDPPPDPSVRAWRHPSEIASAEAAAARFARDEERQAAWAGAPSPTGTATRPLAGLVLVTSALALAAVAAGALAVTSLGAGLSTDAGQAAVGNLEASESSLHRFNPDNLTSAIPPLLDASSTTMGTDLPLATATSVQIRTSISTTTPPSSVPDPNDDMATGEDAGDMTVAQAVYVAVDGRRERVAAFTVDGPYAFTPAAAVAGHAEVLMEYGGLFAPATVLEVDELTGVAVLAPMDPAADELIARVAQAAPATTAMIGDVMDRNYVATASDDTLVYGTLLTITPCPEGAGGAPLVDSSGRLLGMVIDSANPLLAAVPLSDLRAFAGRIAEPDKATTAWLGVELDRAGKQPLAVTAVTAGSPAAAAGLRVGDVIESFESTRIQSPSHLEYLARHTTPGATVTVTVLRDGKGQSVKVTVGATSDRTLGRAV